MNNRPGSTACSLLGLSVLAGLAACAPLSEQEMFEREYQRGEFKAKFLDYREACEAEGGTVIIRSRGRLGPDRMPEYGDHYHCEVP